MTVRDIILTGSTPAWPAAQPDDSLAYSLDVSYDVGTSNIISAVAAIAPSGEMAISEFVAEPQILRVALSGGVAGRSYIVQFDATCDSGQTYQWNVHIRVTASPGTIEQSPPSTAFDVPIFASLLQPATNTSTPYERTEGTGTLGSSGQIVLAAPTGSLKRRWLLIQNQSDVIIPVYIEGRLSNGVTQSFGLVLLASGGTVPSQGSTDERNYNTYVPPGIVKIGSGIGTANKAVCVMEIVS